MRSKKSRRGLVPIGDLVRAKEFRDTLLPRADGQIIDGSPFWYGWAIIDAYIAGLQAGREKQEIEESEGDATDCRHDR